VPTFPDHALERNLSSHRERIELRTGIAGVGGADLLGDVAVQIVEHEADVAIDVPVQRRRVDGLSSSGDAVGGGELIVEIDRADTTGNFPRAQPPPVNENGFAGTMPA